DRDGVQAVLATATVFALPTQECGGWREAAGLVTLEAQSMGVPAVVYDSGGASEMLSDGETGIVVPERNVDALTVALDDVLAMSDADRSALGQRAREWVLAHRSLRQSARELDEHYADVAR